MTRAQLRRRGLSNDDVAAFLQLRSRVGLPGVEDIAGFEGLSDRARQLLSALVPAPAPAPSPSPTGDNPSVSDGPREGDGRDVDVGMRDKTPRLFLALMPDPTLASDKPGRLIVRHTQFAEDEVIDAERPLSLRGPSEHMFHDVSPRHVIELIAMTHDGVVLSKRVFYPPEPQDGFVAESMEWRWKAVPAVIEPEAWSQDGNEIYARLRFETSQRTKPTPLDAVAGNRFLRAGQYQVVGDPLFRFDGYRLSFSVVDEATAKALAQAAGVADGAAAWSRGFAQGDAAVPALLARAALTRGELDFEGNFRAERAVGALDKAVGWHWVLTGPDVIAGYIPDAELTTPHEKLVIFLPARSGGGSVLKDVPYDVSEQALLNRPDLFADDPGTTCAPFDNPGRILGEHRFWTVLRVTQPFVDGAGRTPVAPAEEGERPIDYPRDAVGPKNQIDYEGDLSRFQAKTVAFGHVLEHAVRYRSNGYSLGDVAYSMTLAPRQKRRVLKLDYARRELSRRIEETVAGDEVSDETLRDRSYDDTVSSELNEWSRGKSSAKTSAGAAGLGFAAGPVVIGGAAVTGSASSSASQRGGRSVAASESQQLRDAIRRYGQSLRSLESTVVTETEQTENIEGVSEVVQNINYTRALSVVYYEILRHLRVDTEIAGVSECVFVPMPLLPWTNDRLSKHRGVLRRFARGRYERAMFTHLDDVLDNFANNTIPSGRRAHQPLSRLSGSLFIQMGIEMPQDGSELSEINQNTDRTVYERELVRIRTAALLPFSGYLPFPTPFIVEKTVSASEEVRNRYFQSEIAPHMARRYLDSLVLETKDGTPLDADFTMVGDYRYGRVIRVDFTVELGSSVSRAALEQVTVKLGSDVDLPPRSFANLRSGSLSYANEYYEGRANSDAGYRDLVDGDNGKRDENGAVMFFRLLAADLVDFRVELVRAYEDFKKRLRADTFRFHKALWWGMDADALYTLLDGYGLADGDGRSLASIVEHRPAAIMGNTLVFRTKTDKPIDPMFKAFADLRNHYVGDLPYADPMRISLPTDGLYARAHLDGCVAAEQHNGSFDWVFDNVEPELADFPADMFSSRRSEPAGLQPTPFPETIINLQNAPEAPGVNGLSGVLSTVANAGSFRDMAGLAGTQATLQGAISSASQLAGNFGNMALQQQLARIKADAEAGKNLKSYGAAVQQQVEQGNMTPEAGKKSVTKYAERLAADDAATGAANTKAKAIETISNSPDGGTVVTADEDGVVAVTKPPRTRAPDTPAAVSVVPVPPDKILFMNFETASDRLKTEHIEALELLVGSVGLEMNNVLRIDGHTSTAGSDEFNRDLGQRRANALFAELNRIMNPLDPEVNFTPNFVFSQGEEGSYRAQFRGIPAVRDAAGDGHPNDPVEKAVLLTVGGEFATREPRVIDFFGVKITVTNRIMIINNYAVYALPSGEVKIVQRNDHSVTKVFNDNSTTDNSTTTTTTSTVDGFNVGGNLILAPSGNGVAIANAGTGNTFNITINRGTGFGDASTERAADQKFTAWRLRFHAPSLGGDRQSLETLLGQMAEIVLGMAPASTSSSSSSRLDQLINDVAGQTREFALAKLLKLTGLDSAQAQLAKIFVGTLKFNGTISAAENPAVSVSGKFAGNGIMFGEAQREDSLVILNNQEYTTSQPMSIGEWAGMSELMQTFGFVNQGVTALAPAVATGMQTIANMIIPALPVDQVTGPLVNALRALIEALETVAGPGVQFQALAGDTLKKYGADVTVPQIGQIYVIAATPRSLTFNPS